MLENIYSTYVKLPTRSFPVPDEIRDSLDFWPFFRDCIGAIDGSHIPAFVVNVDQILESERPDIAKRPCCVLHEYGVSLRVTRLGR